MNLAARTEYLKEINELRIRCQSKLESLVASVGWNVESLNRNLQDSTESHEGATPDDIKAAHSLGGGSNQQLEDFEKRYNELISSLPTQQKKSQEKSEAQALAELLEFERNAKRRRISYKNKVHTKNKSHTEVLRELVREQMEVLEEISGEDPRDEKVAEKQDGTEDAEVGLIQLSFTRGNPHKVWMNIGQMVENRGATDDRKAYGVTHGTSSRQHPRKRLKEDWDDGRSSSWRCHDDRDDGHMKRRRVDKYDEQKSKSRSKEFRDRSKEHTEYIRYKDGGRHRCESVKRRSYSPDT